MKKPIAESKTLSEIPQTFIYKENDYGKYRGYQGVGRLCMFHPP